MARYIGRLCFTKMERRAVKSLEFAMITMFLVVVSAGVVGTPSPHVAHAAIAVSNTK